MDCNTNIHAELRSQYCDIAHTIGPSDAGSIDLHMFTIMNKQKDSRAWRRLALFLYKSRAVREANLSNFV